MPPETATTAPPQPATVTRLQLAFRLINHLRKSKTPPYLRHCCLLALADAGKPLTGHEIGLAIADDVSPTGTLDSAIRYGFITRTAGARTTYALTPKGEAEVRTLVNPPLPGA